MSASLLLSLPLALALQAEPVAAPTKGPDLSAWDRYQGDRSLECYGDGALLPEPITFDHEGFHFELRGGEATVTRVGRGGGPLKLGLLSGIKELDESTRAALDGFVERFRREQVDALLVGGDSAEDETHLEPVLQWLAATNLPTLVVIGNWEGRAPFHRAIRAAAKGSPQLLDGQFVRRLVLPGMEVLTLGGYLDRNFVRSSGGCICKPEELEALGTRAASAKQPTFLLTHGPPRQAGKEAIDFVPESGNVGDEKLAEVMKQRSIRFGLFGHILEAGLRATDPAGKAIAAERPAPALFINPGAASALPWTLNGGKTARGAAALFTFEKGKGRVTFLEPKAAPAPKAVK